MPRASKKKLRISQLHWGFPPTIGGVETHLTLLGPELAKRRHKVYLLTGLPDNDVPIEEDYRQMKVTRSPLFDLNWLAKRGFEALELKLKKFFYDYLDKIKPDIIHAHNMHYFSKLHATLLNEYSKKKGVPLVLTAHNVWDDGLFLDLVHDTVDWSHIIAVSQYIKDELICVGYNENEITVVYHGIDTKKFKPGSKNYILKKYPEFKNKKVIFHPARMGLAKGCDTSIKAMQFVKKEVPNSVLVLCGIKNIIDWTSSQEKDIAYILHLVKRLRLDNQVYIDMIPHNLISRFYRLATVSLYPSTACEPFGITMLESLSSGVPMVVTNSGGMPEVIKHGINGLVVRIKDALDLSRCICRIIKDDELRQQMSEAGRQIVLQNYTKEKMTDDTLDVYYSVLGGKH